MHGDLDRYDNVVHCIYDAALQPEHWSGVVGQVARLMEVSRAVLFTWTHSPVEGGFNVTHNIPQAAIELWAAKSMREDPMMTVAVSRGLMAEGHVVIGSELLPKDALIETDFYKELWAPLGIGQVCGGPIFDGTDGYKLPTAMSLFRGLDDALFTKDDAQVLRRLLAHMSRAMGLMYHLRDSEWRVAANEAALDRLGSGVVILDSRRGVRFANKSALRIFRGGRLVHSVAESFAATPSSLRLHHRLASYERRFQQALAQALQPITTDAEHFSQALLLPSEDGKPACAVHAVPLSTSDGFTGKGVDAQAIVFLYDLQSAASVEPALLCRLFDLTPAEARAALQVTQGGSVDAMAARLGVATGTFKTQLQAAYLKSGTHRQADLLKLLLALASH